MSLTGRFLEEVRKQELITPGDRVTVAVSGGPDSVALLIALLQVRGALGIVLSVVHVNHKLRGAESEADERFVQDLAASHSLEFHAWPSPLPEKPKSGIEAAARELRYACFRQEASARPGLKIATGHTLDDQAETVLLRMLRGTGIRGLAGVLPRFPLNDGTSIVGEVIRPFLRFRRAELRDFLCANAQNWREDASNQDPGFRRNRVRHEVLPLLQEKFGDSICENLAGLAEIARAEDQHWLGHPEVRAQAGDLLIEAVLALPLASRRRLLRSWLETQLTGVSSSFALIESVLELTRSSPDRLIDIDAEHQIRRTRNSLRVESRSLTGPVSYEYSLAVPGEVFISELGVRFAAEFVDRNRVPESDRFELLNPDSLPPAVCVRNWRPGDRFWPAHTKHAKKVKELLNERHILGPEKKLWPVIVAGEDTVWMRGFPAGHAYQARLDASRAIRIRERAL